ncbi:unnamed protein product [Coffea canephora]|uniref:DH200=94 genomic scaffold, scaffold_280 n=1 Tax=Coffea canephora TaxID=49390 RepID=A0A068VDV7_COFCA|nr:unnamed protein product [Coffea canephora]
MCSRSSPELVPVLNSRLQKLRLTCLQKTQMPLLCWIECCGFWQATRCSPAPLPPTWMAIMRSKRRQECMDWRRWPSSLYRTKQREEVHLAPCWLCFKIRSSLTVGTN